MYKALLIAVNEQRSQEITTLPNTFNDVSAIHRLLTEEPAIFQQSDVQILSGNLTTKSMLTHTLRSFFEEASPEDVLFLYWAGHGGFSETNAYFLPYDADRHAVGDTSINMSDVRDHIDQTPARTVLSFFDTCHSGALIRSIDSLMDRGLEIKGSGKFVIAACTEDQSAWDRDGHGAFTDHLIRGLEGGATNPSGEVDIYNLYSYVSQALTTEFPNQHPVMKGTLSGPPVIIKNVKTRQDKSNPRPLLEGGQRVIDESGDWFLLGRGVCARYSSYRYNRSDKTHILVLKAENNSKRVEETFKQMWRTEQPFAIEDSAEFVRVDEVDIEVVGGEKTINLKLVSIENKHGNPMFDNASFNGITPDEIAKLRIDHYLFNKEVPSHIKINHSASIIYGMSSDYEVSDQLIPDLLDQHMALECIRLHLIAVLVFKSIVAEVNSLNLYIENHAITRITLEGRRPRVYTNVTPTIITVDQAVHFSLK
ncbi:caspase family protein [Exiguobacterium sp. SL-9]|uniref:caspase family protein n=1 Tax=Exiguobacterium sp. SL-9 TaxID=2510963 RepID=UPI001375E886|nr:caspase family protein [Exiguobacterium sp. SL-9]